MATHHQESSIMKVFRRDVKAVMAQYRITESELAKLCDISTITIKSVLDGHGSPRFDTACRVAAALRLEVGKYVQIAQAERNP